MSRFNKANLIATLKTRADFLQKKHGFDPNNGTAQLVGARAAQDVAVDFGEYRHCLSLIQRIEDGSIVR